MAKLYRVVNTETGESRDNMSVADVKNFKKAKSVNGVIPEKYKL